MRQCLTHGSSDSRIKLANKGPIESMNKTEFFSRRAAARALGVNVLTLENLARMHNLTVWQVPGVRRRYFRRDEIDALLARARKPAAQ